MQPDFTFCPKGKKREPFWFTKNPMSRKHIAVIYVIMFTVKLALFPGLLHLHFLITCITCRCRRPGRMQVIRSF